MKINCQSILLNRYGIVNFVQRIISLSNKAFKEIILFEYNMRVAGKNII